MWDYLVTHWQGLIVGVALMLSPNLLIVGYIAATEIIDRAEARGYDRAWEICKQAQALGKEIV